MKIGLHDSEKDYLKRRYMQIIGQRIRQLRIRNHMTQDALASILCVSGKTISSWERGRTEPDIRSVVKLSALFGVSLDALMIGKNTL